ncbi:sulfotransferase family 2 domain-containing protein [uncultured Thiocystis sp.]|jgi:hypothetical protein|uniref:sulfotransferase family 2 domain-containing protein n=1 Tax=uncultured Thiocystis sp. TaxID=1202134 RepID=UPI0025F1F46E|nr:sulfotransferase family 2 domain-containing protein [uncultured Thiocystis sp.]
MVSRKFKCIFIHIPKVAGTSIKATLEEDSEWRGKDPLPFQPDDYKFSPPPPVSHLPASDYLKYGHVTQLEFESFYKFAFVRNPWDRIVSEYRFRRYPARFDFKTYLFKKLPRPSWTDQYCHIIPQYDFIHDQSGKLLVDFVGKYENLTIDFNYVKEKLGISSRSLQHQNTSSSSPPPKGLPNLVRNIEYGLSVQRWRNTYKDYRQYYDQESREFVAALYSNDIRAFDYEFE